MKEIIFTRDKICNSKRVKLLCKIPDINELVADMLSNSKFRKNAISKRPIVLY